MIKSIVIIEDTLPAFDRLKSLLTGISPDYKIDGPLCSVEEALEYFQAGNTPDLIISDIILTDGTVFDAFDDLDIRSRIIFITAYGEFSIKAFNYNSVHYLLKPIVKKDLEDAISKAEMYYPVKLADIRDTSRPMPRYRERISVDFRDKTEFIMVKDVKYFYYEAGNLYAVLDSQTPVKVNFSLELCRSQLDPKDFYQISRTEVININEPITIQRLSLRKCKVVLNGILEKGFVISREKARELQSILESCKSSR